MAEDGLYGYNQEVPVADSQIRQEFDAWHIEKFGMPTVWTAYRREGWDAGFSAGRSAGLEEQNTCVVCNAHLLPTENMPHCFDCVVTDEVRAAAILQRKEGSQT